MRDIGLVLVREDPVFDHEPLVAGVEHGLEETFVRAGMRLVTLVVPDRAAELDVYRRWYSGRAVDAVVLVKTSRDDERIRFLTQLRVPFVAIVDAAQSGDFSAVTLDSTAQMRLVVDYLRAHGHERIAHLHRSDASDELAGIRADAFTTLAGELGFAGVQPERADATSLRALLAGDDRPTALVFDDDALAAEGVAVVLGAGLAIPGDVAVVSWNDSVVCQTARPPLTAMSNEAHRIGMLAASCLMQAVGMGERTVMTGPLPFIVERESV